MVQRVQKVQRVLLVRWVLDVRLWLFAALITVIAACAPRSVPAPASAQPVAPAEDTEQLADGPGRGILMDACRSCHALTEVTKFRGFYNRAQWRDIVLTMVDYGAPVNEKQVEVLTDYLTAELGKK